MRAVLVSLMLVACGDFVSPSPDTSEAGAAGAPLATAGATTLATGGTVAASTGGATATQTATSQATGGTSTGGAVATGGAKATGGTQTGGAATGGTVSTGGTSAGGTTATGGASAGSGTGTGGYPMGIAGAPGYSCPSSLWDVGIIGGSDRIERSRIGYDAAGMCIGTGEERCGNQACFKISTYRADTIDIELTARSRYTAISRDGKKSCSSVQSATIRSPRLGLQLGTDVGINDRFWLIEEHCGIYDCDTACDSPMAP